MANVTNLIATTLRNRQSKIEDAITNNNALLHRLKKKGRIKNTEGGRTIDEPVLYGENQNATFYTGLDTFAPANDEVIDLATFDWKQQGGFALMTGLEYIQNSGKARVLNMLEAKIQALQATLANGAALSMFGDGTGFAGKEFGGLQLLVADDPTAVGSVGGITQNDNVFWQNKVRNVAGITSSNIQANMNGLYLDTTRVTDKPDLLVAGQNLYEAYWTSLQQIQRITDSKMGQAGFVSLKFQGADLVYDSNCATSRMYFLNTDCICMRAAKSRRWSVGEARTIQNADYDIIPVWMAGNLTVGNRQLQGILRDTT